MTTKFTGKTYKIKSLADIFSLPTAEQMDRCLDELVPFMKSTRRLADIQESIANDVIANEYAGVGEFKLTWPDDGFDWIDDGGVEDVATFQYPDGDGLVMKIKHNRENNQT